MTMTTIANIATALPSATISATPRLSNAAVGAALQTSPYKITNSIGSDIKTSSKLKLEGEDADIIINGVSLKETITAINKKLLILEPKKELHDKHEALREAYEHYKTLEALLHDSG